MVLRTLCTPAYIYLVVSLIAFFIIMIQNKYNSNTYCMGNYTCDVTNIYLIFILKLVYIMIWTWILNMICRSGAPIFSWILLLFPLLFMFMFIIMFFTYNSATIPTTLT